MAKPSIRKKSTRAKTVKRRGADEISPLEAALRYVNVYVQRHESGTRIDSAIVSLLINVSDGSEVITLRHLLDYLVAGARCWHPDWDSIYHLEKCLHALQHLAPFGENPFDGHIGVVEFWFSLWGTEGKWPEIACRNHEIVTLFDRCGAGDITVLAIDSSLNVLHKQGEFLQVAPLSKLFAEQCA